MRLLELEFGCPFGGFVFDHREAATFFDILCGVVFFLFDEGEQVRSGIRTTRLVTLIDCADAMKEKRRPRTAKKQQGCV